MVALLIRVARRSVAWQFEAKPPGVLAQLKISLLLLLEDKLLSHAALGIVVWLAHKRIRKHKSAWPTQQLAKPNQIVTKLQRSSKQSTRAQQHAAAKEDVLRL
jgi:hypothetical protein